MLAITSSIEAKNMHKVFGPHDKAIKGSPKVHVFVIDPIPILSLEQVQGENYIYDYKVIQSCVLKKKAAASITSAVLDTTQYMYGVSKKCPFMGKYGLHFRQGKQSVTIIISDLCAKAIIFCPGSVIDKKHIDLVENSSLVLSIVAALSTTSPTNEKK
jgi:hypothetical protein